ncbi:hypothetical protein ACFQO9_06840 [Chryseobacterium zhengzhouense]|uniref:DUF4369 domain-containing protein n=1 Tax=Chryseobacterium zhengzhouense TaxID=1636086 RepID=A0ABW2LXK7_9FLAO
MKNWIRFPILISLFIIIVISVNINGSEDAKNRDKVLNNNVIFKGYVIDYRVSNNHRFGIIQLKLTESSVNIFSDSLQNEIYPYKIFGDIAELYTTIGDLDYNDTITVKSKSQKIIYEATREYPKYVSELNVIEDSENIKFVKKKTFF